MASLISRGTRFFLVAGTLQLLGPWVKEVLEQYFNVFTIALVLLIGLGFWIVRGHAKKTLKQTASPASDVNAP